MVTNVLCPGPPFRLGDADICEEFTSVRKCTSMVRIFTFDDSHQAYIESTCWLNVRHRQRHLYVSIFSLFVVSLLNNLPSS